MRINVITEKIEFELQKLGNISDALRTVGNRSLAIDIANIDFRITHLIEELNEEHRKEIQEDWKRQQKVIGETIAVAFDSKR